MSSKPNFGINEGVWEYRDRNNSLVCYVVRIRNSDGGKDYIPMYREGGKWKKKGFKPEFKPIYRMQYLDE